MTVELDYRLLTFQGGSIEVILFQMGFWNKVGEPWCNKETLLPAEHHEQVCICHLSRFIETLLRTCL
jgi:hypothetical protein